MKRTALKRTHKQRDRKVKESKRLYRDGKGVAFSEVRSWFPEKVSDWKPIKLVIDPSVADRFHELFTVDRATGPANGLCWFCALERRLFFHHIVGGHGRSNEPCNGFMVCLECHNQIQSNPAELRFVLAAKLICDKQNTDWRRLCELRRCHFEFDLP